MINELKQNQIFVFGSNLSGYHLGGAAKQAFEQFGATYGLGEGWSGKTYAIPTLDKKMNKMSLKNIQRSLGRFVEFANAPIHKDKEFLLTPIGTGIAGFTVEEIKGILPKLPSNVILVGNWD